MTVWSMIARIDSPEARDAVLQAELRRAIARRRFEMHYQPIVDVSDNRVVAMEALVRWRDPMRGLMSPDTFIPAAEQSGLIGPIGVLILEDACRDARTWHERGFDIPVSVNVSARQFDDRAFVGSVYRALEVSGLPPSSLWIEITETCIMHDTEAIAGMIVALRQDGIRVVIDDFGTGYSTLGRIKSVPADVLKIDRCFVRDLPGQDIDRAFISAIVTVAKSCKMTVVAEGVEDAAQIDALRDLGCDLMQGFHFAHPKPIDAIELKAAAVCAD